LGSEPEIRSTYLKYVSSSGVAQLASPMIFCGLSTFAQPCNREVRKQRLQIPRRAALARLKRSDCHEFGLQTEQDPLRILRAFPFLYHPCIHVREPLKYSPIHRLRG